jgi:hypothetical protein
MTADNDHATADEPVVATTAGVIRSARDQDLLNLIAKTASPATMAALLNDLINAETDPAVTDQENTAADHALAFLRGVLEANVGRDEADRMLGLV